MEPDATTTWWLWNAIFADQAVRVVLQVRTLVTGGVEVNTPVAYFAECECGVGVSDSIADSIMIGNEEFAKLRATGAIQPLSPAWAVE